MARAEHPRWRRRAGWALAALVCALAAWLVGLYGFAASIPRALEDDGRHTDAIVVLTGGSLRLETGFQLLARNTADKLFVSGVDRGVPIDDLLAVSGLTVEDLQCCVTLGYMAGDTIENAQETATWIRTNRLRTVRLVTSAYHMPRSLLEFREAMPDVEIVPHPVFADRVMLDDWWRRPGTASLVVVEYNKYLLAIARHRIPGLGIL